jgi:excisionase family DNA binding protein
MMNHLLTVREVAERLAIREGTVRLWLAQGRLPKVKCGRATRIPADSVEKFVRQNTILARGNR